MGLPAQTHVRIERIPSAPSALLMDVSLVLVDYAALSIAVLAGFSCWSLFNSSSPPLPPVMLIAASLCVAAFAYRGLYPGIGMTAVEVVRSISRKISLIYLLLIASMFLMKSWWASSRGGWGCAVDAHDGRDAGDVMNRPDNRAQTRRSARRS